MDSPAQTKRKLETTISTEAVIGGTCKRDKQDTRADLSISEVMDVDEDGRKTSLVSDEQVAVQANEIRERIVKDFSSSTLPDVDENAIPDQAAGPLTSEVNLTAQAPQIEEILEVTTASGSDPTDYPAEAIERQNSLPDDGSSKVSSERRRSRIFETAEKFEGNNNGGPSAVEKPKKIVIPGVSVGSFKKEFERKASLTTLPALPPVSPMEKRLLINSDSVERNEPPIYSRKSSISTAGTDTLGDSSNVDESQKTNQNAVSQSTNSNDNQNSGPLPLSQSDSKSSTFSLEEARRSMENSIALLNQARTESNNDVDQLCAKTESVAVSGTNSMGDRQKKLKNAREIIGNAIPVGRLSGMGKYRIFVADLI